MNNVTKRLWDWADREGNWAKKLVQIVISSGFVQNEQRTQIFNTLLQENGLKEDFDVESIEVPTLYSDNVNNRKLTLTEISNIKGVNRLANEQVLKFSPNLTVIYGNNGSGKSGYGRILKSVGFSYDNNSTVLSDVFEKVEQEQEAHIKYKYGEDDKVFIWDNSTSSPDLKNIAMFNSDCVKFSLDNNRMLIATPSGFHYFNEVSSELNKLGGEITKVIEQKSKQLDFISSLNEGTDSHSFVTELSSQTSIETIDIETKFTEENENSLNDLHSERDKLNVQLLKNEIRSFKNQEEELENLIRKIKQMEATLNEDIWSKYRFLLNTINSLEEERTYKINETIKEKGISFIETNEFVSFLEKAEKYIKTLDGNSYPDENDICIYCGQILDEQARELVQSYRTLMDNSAKKREDESRKQLDGLIEEVKKVDSSCQLHHNPFDLTGSEEGEPEILLEFFTLFNEMKDIMIESKSITSRRFELNYEEIINFIKERKLEIITLKKEKETLLEGIEEKHNEITKQMNELSDKKLLSVNKQRIIDHVNNLIYIDRLSDIRSSLNTRTISRISTQAREELIQNQFKETFDNELFNLRCEIPISLDFGTKAGSPILKQTVGLRYSLSDVLSEGEQKSIALAHLLTELRISNENGPVIFDDPVNSLDHERINTVAQRLISLSQDRQVIIFTHSILFFFAIEQYMQDRKPNIEYKYYTVEPKLMQSGFLFENTPPHKERFNTYVSYIRNLLNTSEENKKIMGSKFAIDGYGFLRSAIELLVEDIIFKSMIKRYRRNIMFSKLEDINGQKIDFIKSELTDIFNEACAYIDAHSNPQEAAYTPNLNRLESDLNKVISIQKRFK